ncbi:MAG: dihydrodipicolinate synthase family protein [Chloroflexota bacterium]
MKSDIYGIVPPITTPFDADENIVPSLLHNEVRYLIEEAGVHGIAVGGSTGEGQTLNVAELRQVVSTAIEAAKGQVPIIAGIIVDSTRQAVEKGEALADLDVAALQITPVHYLFKPDESMTYRHFSAVADQVSAPIIIYNVVPWNYCSPAQLTRIIKEIDGVIGVKQSAGDLKLMADLLYQTGDRGLIMSAVDALMYPSFCLGAHGAIAAILAAAPSLCVQLWDAVKAGDHVLALSLHNRLLPIWNAIEGDNLPACVRCANELQGRPAGQSRSPMQAASPAQEASIREALSVAELI